MYALVCVGATSSSAGTCVNFASMVTATIGASCNIATGPLCKDGHCVRDNAFVANGVCGASALSGGPCHYAYPDPCPAGEYCLLSTGYDGLCTGLPGANQPCVDSNLAMRDCGPYLQCINEVCRPKRRLSESCMADEQCYSTKCDEVEQVCVMPHACTPT